MSDKTKNGVIVVLVCIIAVLVCAIAFVLGMKLADKENEIIDKPNAEVKVEEKIVSYVEEKDGVPYITLNGFEAQNNQIKTFYGSTAKYEYHVSNDILFINIQKNELHGQEGRSYYLNYYIDLNNKKLISVNDVLLSLNTNMDDFNRQCVDCNMNSLNNSIRIMPVGGFIYVESLEMGTFSPFRVYYNK